MICWRQQLAKRAVCRRVALWRSRTAFNVLILLIHKISHATGGWWMASSLLGLFFKVELNQIRESEPTWTFVDVTWSHQRGVCQSQSQASGLCDPQWRSFEERWQAPVDWNKSYKVDFHNLTQIFTDLYRAFRAATADQRYLKASTAQHYQKIIKDLMRKLAGYMTHSQSNFLLDWFLCSYQCYKFSAQRSGSWRVESASQLLDWSAWGFDEFLRWFSKHMFQSILRWFQKFHLYLGKISDLAKFFKWFELKPLSDGPRFRPFCRFEFLICPSFQEIEPYATRCGENPLDWSTNKHQHLHGLHSLHWIKRDLSLSLSLSSSQSRDALRAPADIQRSFLIGASRNPWRQSCGPMISKVKSRASKAVVAVIQACYRDAGIRRLHQWQADCLSSPEADISWSGSY